jgi:hypothetical protein
VEQTARDYLQEIVRKAVKALIRGESGDGWKATHGMFSCSEFAILCQLYQMVPDNSALSFAPEKLLADAYLP